MRFFYKIMKLLELRKSLKQQFNQLGIDEVDADFIIASVLKVNATELNLIDEISNEEMSTIKFVAEQRKQHKPLDKILGYKYFYGIRFQTNLDVLSPRQDSEILVETALKYINLNGYKTVLDLCTGSGCLAVAIKRNADVSVSACDVSQKALNVAKNNAYKNNAIINFFRSNMFENVNNKFDLIVSNPPYIATDDIENLPDEVRLYDPIIALDGGNLGLKYYNIIHDNAKKFLNDAGMLIMEIGEDQADLVISLFNDFNFVEKLKDLNGQDRVLVFKK